MNEADQTTEAQAMALGAQAARSMLSFALNPFEIGTVNWQKWTDGWNDVNVRAAHYADDTIKADKERQQWSRDVRTGALDPRVGDRSERTFEREKNQ